jgi:hypothetical protein
MRLAVVVLVGVALTSGARAQGGGKAEPNRLSFARNASSVSAAGSARGGVEYEYSFGAKRGQRATISVRAVPGLSVAVELSVLGGAPVELKSNGKGAWTATLPESGEYLLVLKRVRRDGRTSRYTLTLAIH